MAEELKTEKSLIICATVRTGSTMIYDDLRAILGLKSAHGEILVKRLFRGAERLNFPSAWRHIREENKAQSLVLHKVMFQHIASISRAIESDEPVEFKPDSQFDPRKCDSFQQFFRDSFWVHVQRKDVFAQTVSRYIAYASGIWRAADVDRNAADNYNEYIQYDSKMILDLLEHTYHEREQWKLFFSHYDIKPLLIHYETAVAHYPDYLDEIIRVASLTPATPTLARRKIKLGNTKNIELRNMLIKDAKDRISKDGEDSSLLKSIYESSIVG